MNGGGAKQLLAAYGVPHHRQARGDEFSFDDRSLAAKKTRSTELAIPEINFNKESSVDQSKSKKRRDSIKIEDEEAVADACGCHLCGTFMQYRLRGRKNEDNSEELVADIWCTGDGGSSGGNEIQAGKGAHYGQEPMGSAIQLTKGLQSLIEILESDTGGGSKAGLSQSTIDSIVCHRYDSDISGVKCSVCMDELRNGDVVKCLPCLHNFHAKWYYDPGRQLLLSLFSSGDTTPGHHHQGSLATLGEQHHHSYHQDDSGLDWLRTLTYVAMALSVLSVLSPLPDFMEMLRAKRAKGSALPYSTLFTQAYLWVWYGYLTAHWDIVRINLLTVLISAFYVGVFASYDIRVISKAATLLSVMAVVVGALICNTSLTDMKLKVEVFAYCATALSIVLCIAPTPQIVTVVRSRSLDGYPTALTVASFISSCLWAQCSILMHSLPYLIPNLVGVILNGGQLVVVIWVYTNPDPDPLVISPTTMSPEEHAAEIVPRLISQAKSRRKSEIFGEGDNFTVYGSVFTAYD
ncbi:hypothetical protein FOL47_003494 [Perkinsus chesapeaki]|uniref:RING-type domain-containing protein n=1 Tax=Perkinsus chesapeaki TaxID=330153 RepID=A0A7J6M8Y9_PERCH|nr:hypothetical protein FOL47_003494 [Perkinsus chesapeaki]